MNFDTEHSFHTRWIALSDDEGGGHTIHGVALPPDTTARSDGDDVHFPSGEIEKAADTLTGESISVGHPDDWPYPVEDTVGRITKSEWSDELGLVYEGVVADDDIARKIDAGVVDVSAHIHSNDGDTTEDGAIMAEDMLFTGLGVVSQGAASGNTAETGPLALEADLGGGAGAESVEYTLSTVQDALTTTDDGYETPEDFGESKNQSDNTMTDDKDDFEERISALESKLDEKTERVDALETELEDKQERIAALEDEREEREADIKLEYAEALAGGSPLSADSMVDAFGFEDLKSQYETALEAGEIESVAESGTEPDVQSGGGSGSGGGGGSDGVSDDDRERIGVLEDEIGELEGKSRMTVTDEVGVEVRKEELAELRGEN